MANVVDIFNNPHILHKLLATSRGLRLLPFVVAALLTLLSSCHRENETDRQLADIEEKLYLSGKYADTAKILIDSICRSTRLSERGEALKNLIWAQTTVWPDLTQDNDSIESQAIDYFKRTGDEKLLTRARIERGYVRIHLGQLDKAIVDALDALQYASSVNDSLGLGRAELLLANIYREAYRSDLSIPHREKAVELLRKYGSTSQGFRGTQYALIAWDYHHLHNDAKCIAMLDSLLSTGEFTESSTVAYMRNTLMCPYVVTGQFDKASQQFDSIRGYYMDGRFNEANWYVIVQMYMGMNQPDSVRFYLNILKDNYGSYDGNWFYYEFSHRLEAAAGNYEQAYADLLNARNIMDSRSVRTKAVSPEVAEKDYWDLKVQEEQKNASQRKTIISVILLAGLVILAFGVMKYIRLKRIHRMEIEENLFNIRELQKAVEQVKKTDAGTVGVVKSVIDTINVLSTEYFAYMDCPYDATSQLVERMGNEMENLRTDEYLDKIVTIADSVHNGELKVLMDDSQLKLKPADLYLLALKMLSFSPKSICWFLKIKPATYYTRWKRLRQKIKGDVSSVGEQILLKIEEL